MTSIFESVLRISAEAAVLAVLVLVARLIVGRRPGILLTALYALIAVRLIVPLAISSPLSVHNIWIEPQTQIEAAIGSGDAFAAEDTQTPVYTETPKTQEPQGAVISETSSMPIAAEPERTAAPLTAIEIAAFVWVLGMIVFSGVMLTGNALFMRRIRRNRIYDAPEFIGLLNECRQTLGLKRSIRAVCASETGTAAVYGVLRPVLLISSASFESLTEAQQRHVLLHELAHIRRRDPLVCAGATVLNIVHWFNPLVWIVFALMRRDIEVQCDAHVFRGLPGAERADYAGTLLKLAGPVQTPKLAPALFISKANIKRRIVMIMKHRKKSALFTAAALLLTVLVAVTGCTTAVDQKAEALTPEPKESAVVEAAPEATPTPAPETSGPADEPELMASFTIDNSHHDNENRMANVQKAADILSGTVIKPGETLSLNDMLGPRNAATAETVGWKEAAGIEDGAYVSEIGGGVTAVATALYNAAIRAELEITDCKHGAIPSDLVDGGLDATISTGGPDLKIKNPYESNVTIEAKLEDLLLTVSVYGQPMDYTVDFYSEKAADKDEDPVTVYIYDSATAPDGTKIAPGESHEYSVERPQATYNVYKIFYAADGSETKRELFQTVKLIAIKGIVYVNGPDPATVPASSDSAVEPTPTPTPKPTSVPSAEVGSAKK